MTSRLNPYLSFKDNARQAMEFYKTVFGGELTMSTFKEGGMPSSPADESKIMHADLRAPNGFVLMGSDTPTGVPYQPGGSFSISLSGDDEAELRGYWDKLADGGSITMPLDKAPWGDSFGMLSDMFDIAWLVNISGTPQK